MKKTNRWLILLAAILTNLALGSGYAWSVYQQALLAENPSWAITQTSLAYSISFAMVPLGMILFGKMVDNRQVKKVVFIGGVLFGLGMFTTGFAKSIPMLYLSYGILAGLGIGAGYGAATSVSVKWFPDKKGMAGGLTAAGFGSGAIILAPLANSLIDKYGISTTFKIMGAGLFLVIILASFVMKEAPIVKNSGAVSTDLTDKTWKEMVKEGKFWLLWIIYVLAAVAGMMIIGHTANIATDYDLAKPALIVMVVGLSNTLGRIAWGSISDKLGRYKTVILMFIASALGLVLIYLNPQIGTFAAVIGLVLVASSFGGFLGSYPGITAENWGAKNAGSNYGFMFTAYGVAAIVGPSLASNIKTSSGTYGLAFVIAAGMSLIGLILMMTYLKKNK